MCVLRNFILLTNLRKDFGIFAVPGLRLETFYHILEKRLYIRVGGWNFLFVNVISQTQTWSFSFSAI